MSSGLTVLNRKREPLCSHASFLHSLPTYCSLGWTFVATRPMARARAIERVNGHGWGTTFSHSFRIGGASFYLSQKVDPVIFRLTGRWHTRHTFGRFNSISLVSLVKYIKPWHSGWACLAFCQGQRHDRWTTTFYFVYALMPCLIAAGVHGSHLYE